MIEIFTIFSGLIALFNIFYKLNINAKLIILWIFLFFLIFFDGLRWETGNDWQNYFNSFNNVLDIHTPGFEFGFTYYEILIRSFTSNYSIFLLITSFIIYIGIFYNIFKMTNYSFISIFYLTGLIPWYAGSMRQIMASLFFILSFKYIFTRKLLKFSIVIFLGGLFHSSILPFYFIYFLYGSTIFYYFLSAFILIIISISFKFLIPQIDAIISIVSDGRSIESRGGGTLDTSNPFLGFARKIFTIFSSFFFLTSVKDTVLIKNKISFFFYLSCYSLIFYFIGTYFISHVSSRLDIYTSIIILSIFFGLVESITISKLKLFYLFIFITLLLLIFYSRLEYLELFHPYKSIFYNTNYQRDLF